MTHFANCTVLQTNASAGKRNHSPTIPKRRCAVRAVRGFPHSASGAGSTILKTQTGETPKLESVGCGLPLFFSFSSRGCVAVDAPLLSKHRDSRVGDRPRASPGVAPDAIAVTAAEFLFWDLYPHPLGTWFRGAESSRQGSPRTPCLHPQRIHCTLSLLKGERSERGKKPPDRKPSTELIREAYTQHGQGTLTRRLASLWHIIDGGSAVPRPGNGAIFVTRQTHEAISRGLAGGLRARNKSRLRDGPRRERNGGRGGEETGGEIVSHRPKRELPPLLPTPRASAEKEAPAISPNTRRLSSSPVRGAVKPGRTSATEKEAAEQPDETTRAGKDTGEGNINKYRIHAHTKGERARITAGVGERKKSTTAMRERAVAASLEVVEASTKCALTKVSSPTTLPPPPGDLSSGSWTHLSRCGPLANHTERICMPAGPALLAHKAGRGKQGGNWGEGGSFAYALHPSFPLYFHRYCRAQRLRLAWQPTKRRVPRERISAALDNTQRGQGATPLCFGAKGSSQPDNCN
ncbi:hypothetical protein HPB48_010576 [Haemaphysalis longicornis]|uniref:Uncharacterized protein n=1 Tax=Haemaphysalis longicornis TaxID=44386 RepID=A0A9J6H2A4_HAELO|nr:hypothetical protein HPB48_010576 [Haemaphysalis longicornis]